MKKQAVETNKETVMERRKCPQGHLLDGNRHAESCRGCFHKTARGRVLNLRSVKRYQKTVKGHAQKKACRLRMYYKRLLQYGDPRIAVYTIVPGNEEETQRRLDKRRIRGTKGSRRRRERWGRTDSNSVQRVRWENIREGIWKESEHPLGQEETQTWQEG